LLSSDVVVEEICTILVRFFEFLRRLFRVDLIKWVSNVCTSIHPQFLRFQWNLACRYRWM